MIQVCKLRNRWMNQNNSFYEVQFQSDDNINVIACSIKTLKKLYDILGVN